MSGKGCENRDSLMFRSDHNFHFQTLCGFPQVVYEMEAFSNGNLAPDPGVGKIKKVFVEWIKINGLETFLAARRRGKGRVLKLGENFELMAVVPPPPPLLPSPPASEQISLL